MGKTRQRARAVVSDRQNCGSHNALTHRCVPFTKQQAP